VGLAIPADTVRRTVNMLIRHQGRMVRPALGVHCAADAQAAQLGLAGALVIDVAPGSGAAAAGIHGTYRDGRDGALVLGDVITAVGGAPVRSVEDVLAAVEEREVGERVRVTLQREGREREASVVLQEREDAPR
jgi:S1-C subfamily serine protease